MSKRAPKSREAEAAPAAGPIVRRFGSELVAVASVFKVPDLRVREPGRWQREADKIAWQDAATGLGCIIRRSECGGHLCGYVGVGPEHPLFGFEPRAMVADLGIHVHGGISYGEPCREGPEETSICHVVEPDLGDVSDLMWWLGFECNQPYDLVPGIQIRPDRHVADVSTAPVYRDEAYVFAECTKLASQLADVGRGERPAPRHDAPPPIGLDPSRSGRR